MGLITALIVSLMATGLLQLIVLVVAMPILLLLQAIGAVQNALGMSPAVTLIAMVLLVSLVLCAIAQGPSTQSRRKRTAHHRPDDSAPGLSQPRG